MLSVGTLRQPRSFWPLVGDDFFDILFEAPALISLIGQENHADAVFARVRQLKPEPAAGIF